ncbi:MAG: phosphatase domain-containing protein, partial [Bacteriovoracaceae bacterium]
MAKKITFFSFLLSLFIGFSTASAQIAIISDLDETIKRTNVANPARALYNALFTQKIFSGMNDLYREMDSYASDLYVLSASPKIFRHNIFNLLKKHDFNPVKVYTRKGLENKFWYKNNVVKDVLSKDYEKIILVGDDLE